MVAVRQAEPKDADAAVDVLRRSITVLCAADHRGDSDTIEKWLANKTVKIFLAWLANKDNVCVVAEASDQTMGVGLLHRSGEIRLCYVAPGSQRQGIGRAIILELEQSAGAMELLKVTLDSTGSARPFYERLGYRTAGEPQPGFGVSLRHPYEKTLRPDPISNGRTDSD
jgi:GNAT superfamily N-acetyltransferase